MFKKVMSEKNISNEKTQFLLLIKQALELLELHKQFLDQHLSIQLLLLQLNINYVAESLVENPIRTYIIAKDGSTYLSNLCVGLSQIAEKNKDEKVVTVLKSLKTYMDGKKEPTITEEQPNKIFKKKAKQHTIHSLVLKLFSLKEPLYVKKNSYWNKAEKWEQEKQVELLSKLESLLKSNNCDINKKEDGETPIFHAIRSRCFKAVQLLIQYGADLTVITDESYANDKKLTPKTLAEHMGNSEIINIINESLGYNDPKNLDQQTCKI